MDKQPNNSVGRGRKAGRGAARGAGGGPGGRGAGFGGRNRGGQFRGKNYYINQLEFNSFCTFSMSSDFCILYFFNDI